MTPSLLASVIFAVLAVILLIAVILIRNDLISKYRKFFVATEAIYLSGALMVLIACAVLKEMPLSFALIADILILFIYAMTTVALFTVAGKAEKMKSQINENKEQNN